MSADFLELRALVWRKPAAKADAPLRDPLGDLITHGLVEADLWRSGSTLELESAGGMVRARVFLPERSQGSRDLDLEVAHKMRSVIMSALLAAGHGSIFTDALWMASPARGWSVVARGRAQSAGTLAEASWRL